MKNEEFLRFQLGKLLLLRKCIFILKNFLNDFGKTVETCLDPRLDSVYFFLLLSLSLSLFLSSSALFSSPPAFWNIYFCPSDPQTKPATRFPIGIFSACMKRRHYFRTVVLLNKLKLFERNLFYQKRRWSCDFIACVAGVNGEGEGERERGRKMGFWE